MEDIEIARNSNLKDINVIAENLRIPDEYVINYGKKKAKISLEFYKKLQDKQDGKLILVTAISPTPLGEGKTTTAIGLADGMAKLQKKVILALREPSLGPVFGIKGGATGGGYSQVAPMEDINLHFTGDIHAITSANNLLSAMIDNHIYFGNELQFDKVVWKRCLDLNDRALRNVKVSLDGMKNSVPRDESFDISVASEIMAIFCLASDLDDLKRRLGNITVGYKSTGEPIKAKDLKAEGALTVLLKDAFQPNLVQTLENNPCIIHGGPFANIAHGCNSVIATKFALKLGDYCITEAGFGADLGAEKFLNIKCRKANLKPATIVCVATIRALKYHGGVPKEEVQEENIQALEKGFDNLKRHVNNLKNKFGINTIVAINQFSTDSNAELEFLKEKLQDENIDYSTNTAWADGGEGCIDLANKVINLCEKSNSINFTYDLNDSITEKLEKVAKNIYGATGIELSEKAIEKIKQIEKLGYSDFPICIAKTQYSFSDDPKNLECRDDYKIHIKDIEIKTGAEFIVALAGNIYTMPGLPKNPAAEKIDLDENENIMGIF